MEQRINVNEHAARDGFGWFFVGFGKVCLGHLKGVMAANHRLVGFSTSNPAIQQGDVRGLTFNLMPDEPGPLFSTDDMLVTNDYRTVMNNSRIDGFVVAAPTDKHVEIALELARTGKHVFVEKPAAPTYAEGRRLLKAFDGTLGKLVVGQVLPAFAEFGYLRKELMRLGLENVVLLQMQRHVPWSAAEDQTGTGGRGGFAADLGIHDVNFLAGCGTPELVSVGDKEELHGHWQRLKIQLGMKGCAGKFEVNVGASKSHASFHHGYFVSFADGTNIRFDGKTVFYNSAPVALPPKGIGEVFGDELKTAAAYFRGAAETAVYLDATAAVETLRILEAANESARNDGKAIKL